MSEFNPMEELGLVHDKQLICGCEGFLSANNSTRDLCERFIGNGARFYDIISRYDNMTANLLNRTDGRLGNATKFVTPFLKAFGATDYDMHRYSRETLKLIPEAKKVVGHLMNMIPTFVTTSSFEHNIMNICELLDIPRGVVECSEVNMDNFDLGRQDARAVREFAGRITALKLSKHNYDLSMENRLTREDSAMIRTLDEIFRDELKETDAATLMKSVKSVGANEKAYFLLDVRKRTQIDFDGTAFVGGDITDLQVMDLVREGDGLALSFNGAAMTVRGSNIAVLSRDCTVAGVLIKEFYNEGIEAVFDLVEHWDRKTLESRECPDPYMMKAMLEANPRKLPEVHVVDRYNVNEIAEKSEKYREKLLLEGNYSGT